MLQSIVYLQNFHSFETLLSSSFNHIECITIHLTRNEECLIWKKLGRTNKLKPYNLIELPLDVSKEAHENNTETDILASSVRSNKNNNTKDHLLLTSEPKGPVKTNTHKQNHLLTAYLLLRHNWLLVLLSK